MEKGLRVPNVFAERLLRRSPSGVFRFFRRESKEKNLKEGTARQREEKPGDDRDDLRKGVMVPIGAKLGEIAPSEVLTLTEGRAEGVTIDHHRL